MMRFGGKEGKMQIGLGTLLGVVFIILKLCGVISWSWGWVLSPFWIAALIYVIVILVAVILDKRYWKKITRK